MHDIPDRLLQEMRSPRSGSIVNDCPGRGASVSHSSQCVAQLAETVRPASATIMVVDDEAEVRMIVSEFLEDSGYRVLQADGAAAALRLLDVEPGVQLLVTDIRMPDMSGLELADRVTVTRPNLKIILISGYFVAQQVQRRFLRKPFRMRELAAAVRAELGEAD